MKIKKYKNKYSNKVNKIFFRKREDFAWIIKITLIAFTISFLFSFITESTIPYCNIFISFLIVIFFVLFGIIFDMIGISVTVAKVDTFNSMAAKKVIGAKACIKLIRMSSKVSSFCNDVIGDICGILSGSAGAAIAIAINKLYSINLLLITLIVTSLISAFTIGGKALGKSVAINKANDILYKFTRILIIFASNLDK